MNTGFAELEGGRLYYETTGSGDAIVLIHGNAGDRRHWDAQFDALAKEHRVVRYDVRGFGQSSLPVEGEPYSNHEDLAALLDHLSIRSAHVAGWSMGSGIAVDFVLTYPDRMKSLISVGPWVRGYSSPAAQAISADLRLVGAALADGGPTAAVDAWMAAPFFAATIREPAAGARFRQIAADYSWWFFSHQAPKGEPGPSAVGRTAEIHVPTLILTAEHDIPACLEVADLLDLSVLNSRKVILAGTGHLLHMEKPEEFNRHLLDFIETVSRRDA
jgi:pimeloyl-ACP methyl ester carboxylesterase